MVPGLLVLSDDAEELTRGGEVGEGRDWMDNSCFWVCGWEATEVSPSCFPQIGPLLFVISALV